MWKLVFVIVHVGILASTKANFEYKSVKNERQPKLINNSDCLPFSLKRYVALPITIPDESTTATNILLTYTIAHVHNRIQIYSVLKRDIFPASIR